MNGIDLRSCIHAIAGAIVQNLRADASPLPRPKQRATLLMSLEPRIMFDGAVVATADAMLADASAHALIPDVPAVAECASHWCVGLVSQSVKRYVAIDGKLTN